MVINAKNSILAFITLLMSLIKKKKKKNTLDENALNRHATFCMF